MQWLINRKESFEVLYYLSGIILALASMFAAWQIYLAKKSLLLATKTFELAKADSLVRSKREAIVLAAESCEKFAKEILPSIDESIHQIGLLHIKDNSWDLVNNALNEDSIKDWNEANNWISELRKTDAVNKVIDTLNLLESLAIYLVKGAADEQVAFPSISVSFCEYVNTVAPYLIMLRQKKIPGQISGPFQNVATLYALWSDRINKESLQLESSRINEKLSKIHSSEIPPISV